MKIDNHQNDLVLTFPHAAGWTPGWGEGAEGEVRRGERESEREEGHAPVWEKDQGNNERVPGEQHLTCPAQD